MTTLNYLMAGFGVAYLVNGLIHGGVLVHIYNLFVKKDEHLYTRDELKYKLMTKLPAFFHELLHCELCLCLTVAALLTLGKATHPLEIAGSAGLGYTLILLWQKLYVQAASVTVEPDKEPAPDVKAEIQALMGVSSVERKEEPEKSKKACQLKVRDTRYQFGEYWVREAGSEEWKLEKSDPDKDMYLKWLDKPQTLCKASPSACMDLHADYLAEIKELERKAAEKGVPCASCAKGAVQNKYYQKIRKLHHASLNSKVSRSGEKV